MSSTKDKFTQNAPKVSASGDMPLIRRKDGGTNYISWREHTGMKLRALYPEIYLEFTEGAIEETTEEARVRVELENPQIVLLNDTTSVVPQEVFDLWIDHPSQGRRQQAFQVAIEEVRDERRLLNQSAISANKVKTASYIYEVELVAKKRLLRLAMSATLLGPKFVSADCLVTIQADGRFLTGHGQVTPAFVIHQIIMERLQQILDPCRSSVSRLSYV